MNKPPTKVTLLTSYDAISHRLRSTSRNGSYDKQAMPVEISVRERGDIGWGLGDNGREGTGGGDGGDGGGAVEMYTPTFLVDRMGGYQWL